MPDDLDSDINPAKSHQFWLFCICTGMFVYFSQVTMLFPVLPLYVAERWHETSVGFVVVAMALGLLCFHPFIGWLIDLVDLYLV